MKNKNVAQLIEQIRGLEKESRQELHKKQEEFFYTVDRKKVRFEEQTRQQHLRLKKKLR